MSLARPAIALASALLLAVSCGGSRKDIAGDPSAPAAALYRARFDPGDGEKARRFRLLVHAGDPDRLHGEIVSAVGTTELVLDAGPERVSVFFVRERVAFVGDADERALDALLGVPLSPRTLVDVLLGRQPADSELDWTIVQGDHRYPAEIELGDGTRTLALRLKRLRQIRADPASLGTGQPPDGVEQRPLDMLDPTTVPGIETEDEDGT